MPWRSFGNFSASAWPIKSFGTGRLNAMLPVHIPKRLTIKTQGRFNKKFMVKFGSWAHGQTLTRVHLNASTRSR